MLSKNPIENPHAVFIGGKWIKPGNNSYIDVRDSSTEDVFVTVAEAGPDEVERAVAAARQAFDYGPWPRLTHAERAHYLRKIAKEIVARADDIADTWVRESGVILAAAAAAAPTVAAAFEFYADRAVDYPFIEEHVPSAGNIGLLVREPVGVVLAILPWNGPIFGMGYKVAPALLAGCSVIIKASPEAPASIYIFAEICEKIGLPAGVVNILTADRNVAELLVRHSGVDKVTFTGSTAAGRKIGAICGDRVARCTLELGGKSAAVILDDYDVAKAAETIAGMATWVSGQVCSSLTRIIVTRKRHDDLVDALSTAFGSVRVGNPFEAETQMGPLSSAHHRDRVEGYIQKGITEGARVACGGGRPAYLNRGYYVEPTVFADVDNNHVIAREEIFGPVLSVIPAMDEAAAVQIANDTIFGLNASVFTNDADIAYRVARELRSGTVGHNSFRTDFGIAFGGFKQSGIGREGGTEGLHSYLETKTVILDAYPPSLERRTSDHI